MQCFAAHYSPFTMHHSLFMSDTPLKKLLLDTLRRGGPMTFERYMEQCLYHPEFGYYTQGHDRTGVGGDYFTSSDLDPVFARLIARQAAEMWDAMGQPRTFTWVEMGAGRGIFAADFLSWCADALPDFADALDYMAIEPGARQRQRIAARLADAGFAGRARLFANLDELAPVAGCFFSNELIDAFPVSVVARTDGRLKEIYVTADGNDLREKTGAISDSHVAAYVARYAPQLEEGCRMEVNRQALSWIHAVSAKLASGYVLTIDYGDMANRLFTDDRPRGTLLAYHGHTADEDYFAAPGEADLTAHVNFSALIDAGEAHEIDSAKFTTQERFLLALGELNQFADVYDRGQTELEMLNARLRLKRLISPEGMGNIFKVLVQHRAAPKTELTGWKFECDESEPMGSSDHRVGKRSSGGPAPAAVGPPVSKDHSPRTNDTRHVFNDPMTQWRDRPIGKTNPPGGEGQSMPEKRKAERRRYERRVARRRITTTHQAILDAARNFKNNGSSQNWTTIVEGQEFPARLLLIKAAQVAENHPTNSGEAAVILSDLGFEVRYKGTTVRSEDLPD
jgi:SAM-dependent MidA family methyltransferase